MKSVLKVTISATLSAIVIASSVATTPASAKSSTRMFSVDHTQGPSPVFHDNGVDDGRVCHIFFTEVWDSWTEDFVTRKVKRCEQF